MRLAIEFGGDLSPEELEEDPLTFSAVLHQLMVLGEAVKWLSPAFLETRPDLPWSEMAGMRDRLIHRYDEVDASIVWEAVHEELPSLIVSLERDAPDEQD